MPEVSLAEDEAQAVSVAMVDEFGFFAFLNDAGTTFDLLDVDCAIRSDSARQIIKHRDGRDKTLGTADDDLFESVAELDSVPMVGGWTIDRLYECADAYGWILYDRFYDTGAYPGETTTEIYGYANLSPELQGAVDMLYPDALGYESEYAYQRMVFSRALIFARDGVPTHYQIIFRQLIDPEGGIVSNVYYSLNADLEVLEVFFSI